MYYGIIQPCIIKKAPNDGDLLFALIHDKDVFYESYAFFFDKSNTNNTFFE